MIRRGTKLQLLAFAILTLLGVTYTSARYVGFDELLGGAGYVVTADLAESGGIFENAEVTYRGVTVGRVDRLRLSGDGVLADLRITSGRPVPSDVTAVVEDRSAIGEQYVDLQPDRDGGPFLGDGDRIPRDRTRIPLATTELLVNLDRLVRSVDRDDLATVVDELGKAFAGTGPDLQRLLDSGDALTRAATDTLPQTVTLLRDGTTVLATQRESGSAIRSFSDDLAAFSTTLAAADPDLRRILDGGVVAASELDALVTTNRAAIGQLVTNLISGAQVTVARLPGLRQILVTYPNVVGGGYTVVPGDGTAHFGLVLNASDPPPCTRGYEGTSRRTPLDTAPRPANAQARCTEPRGSATSVRGAQNAPRPSAGGARPLLGWDGSTNERYVAGVDAATGRAYAPGGAPVSIGERGGQAAVFGKDSWQWLLLGPLGR